jgi:hypothetical protein|tara:strand:- start:334 stop:633 length:300 start_codon:yes stop_codon:yes gene_type:complete
MKLKLRLVRDDKEEFLWTNLWCIAEWERIENRRVSDGRNIGVSDYCCWAYLLLELKGETLPATWRQWLKENPAMECEPAGEEEIPNPTDAATGDNSPNL